MGVTVKKSLLLLEFTLVFLCIPTAILLELIPIDKMRLLLILALLFLTILLSDPAFKAAEIFSFRITNFPIRSIGIRFLVSSALLVLLSLVISPQNFFSLPAGDPLLWLATAVFYPLLSALPQEILYRPFLFHRYRLLFSTPKQLIIASTLSFSYMHIIFNNPIAVALTLIGGYFFSKTYAASHSFWLVTLEHSAYGFIVFTVGLGDFFR